MEKQRNRNTTSSRIGVRTTCRVLNETLQFHCFSPTKTHKGNLRNKTKQQVTRHHGSSHCRPDCGETETESTPRRWFLLWNIQRHFYCPTFVSAPARLWVMWSFHLSDFSFLIWICSFLVYHVLGLHLDLEFWIVNVFEWYWILMPRFIIHMWGVKNPNFSTSQYYWIWNV